MLQSFLQLKSSDHTFKQRFTSTFTPAKRKFCLACKRNCIFIYWIFICLIYASPQTALKAKYLDWQPWKNWEHRDKEQMLISLLSTLKGRFILLKMPKKKTHDVVNNAQYIITRTGLPCWLILKQYNHTCFNSFIGKKFTEKGNGWLKFFVISKQYKLQDLLLHNQVFINTKCNQITKSIS